MSETPIITIVYGTLRQGCPNNKRLKTAKYIGSGKLVKLATMYNYYAYPILSLSPSSEHQIFVEVYEIDEQILEELDQREGYPRHNTRTIEEVKLENGETVKGWLYHQKETDYIKKLTVVKSGDWLKFKIEETAIKH